MPQPRRMALKALVGSAQILVATGVAGVLAYVTQALVARLLGPAEYGLAGTLLATYNFVFLVLSPGTVTITGLVAGATGRGDEARVAGAIRATVLVALVLAVAIGFGLLIPRAAIESLWHIDNPLVTVLFVGLLAGGFLLACAAAVLRGLQRLLVLSAVFVVDPVVRLAIIVVPGVLAVGTPAVLAAYGAGALSALAIAVGGFWRWLRLPGPRPRRHEVMGISAGALLLAATIGFAHHAPLALARATLGAVDSGYFAAIVTLSTALLLIAEPVGSVLYPMVAAEAHRGGDTRPILLASAAVLLVTIGGAAGLLWLLAGLIMTLTFGADYAPAAAFLGSYAGSRALWVVVVFLASYALAHERLLTVALATVAALVQVGLLFVWGGSIAGIANAGWAGALLGAVLLAVASLRDESRVRKWDLVPSE